MDQPATLPFVPEQPDSTAPPTTSKSPDAKPVTRPVMDDTMPVPGCDYDDPRQRCSSGGACDGSGDAAVK